MKPQITRRDFVRDLSAGLAGVSLHSSFGLHAPYFEAGTKMAYRRLGRTGFQVSEIGLGGHFDGPNWRAKNSKEQSRRDLIFEECVKRGVNYLDTNTENERQSLALSLKRMPQIRERVLVVADVNDQDSPADAIYDFLLVSVEEQLQNLQLPYVDVLRFTTVARKSPPERCEAAIKAFTKIKREGKAKYLAFSQHDPDLLLEWVNRYDEIDIIYVPYNYFAGKADRELFSAAGRKDLGIIVIKPFNKGTIFDPRLAALVQGSGARSVIERAENEKQSRTPEELTRGNNLTLAQASLRFILSRPEVSTVIPGMETVDEVRENLNVAGTGSQFGMSERRVLDLYAARVQNALPENYRWLNDWRRT